MTLSEARIAVLGCGAVGSAFASELVETAAEVVLWSRTSVRAEALAKRLGSRPRVAGAAGEALADAHVALLCVTDAVLASFAEECAGGLTDTAAERVVLHTNGFHGLDVLAPFAAKKWGIGKLHPLVALPPTDEPGRLRAVWFATASTPAARPRIEEILGALDARELPLGDAEESSRTLHAAAALLSGGLVALFEIAAAVARDATEDPDATEKAFLALLASTAGNLWLRGPGEALTGPAARGAVAVVAAHLETLDAKDPEAAVLYRRLGLRMAALAAERGSITAAERQALEGLLG